MLLTGSNSNYEKISADTHNAVAVAVYDIGTHAGEYKGVPKKNHQMIVVFEVDEQNEAGENKDISKFYTASLSSQSNLRKDLKSMRGEDFTEAELKGFDSKNIIGLPCMIEVAHINEKPRIVAIAKKPKAMPTLLATGDYAETPAWVQKFIDCSLEKQAVNPTNPSPKTNPTTAQDKRDAAMDAAGLNDDEDDIPF